MARISLQDYWMGRDQKYWSECTPEIRLNADELVHRVNGLLAMAEVDGVEPGWDEKNRSHVASGWRPLGVNEATANAGRASKHITARGVDLRDTTERSLARWCLKNLEVLEQFRLWMEDPRWTPSWVHLQSVPPGSGKRVYIPSASRPIVAALKEQGGLA